MIYNQDWVTWTAYHIALESWRDRGVAIHRLRRAIIVGQAHGLNIVDFELTLRELEPTPNELESIFGASIAAEGEGRATCQWTSFERACVDLLEGLDLAKRAFLETNGGVHSVTAEKSANLIGAALEPLWAGLPLQQREHIAQVYLRAVAITTVDGHQPDILRRALALAETLAIPRIGVWGTMMLHHEGRHAEACDALYSILAKDSQNADASFWLAHELADHFDDKKEEALVVLDKGLSSSDDLRLWEQKGRILGELGRVEAGIATLRERLYRSEDENRFGESESRADCFAQLGRLYEMAGGLSEAEVELRRALEFNPKKTDALLSLASVLEKNSRLPEAEAVRKKAFDLGPTDVSAVLSFARSLELNGKEIEKLPLYETALAAAPRGTNEWATFANLVAWELYIRGQRLSEAERLAAESLGVSDSLATLQTLFAVQCRSGRWDAADNYYRQYLREDSVSAITGSRWKYDILFFRDVVVANREKWAVNAILQELNAPRDNRWEVIRIALTGESAPEHLRGSVKVVAEQFRSDERDPKFPLLS